MMLVNKIISIAAVLAATVITATAQFSYYDLTLSEPTLATTINTGEQLTVEWEVNNPDDAYWMISYSEVRLIILLEGSTTVLHESETFAYDAGSFVWGIPDNLPTGKYWVALCEGSSSYSVAGYAPATSDGLSNAGFLVTRAGCPSHSACDADEYCDAEKYCYACDACSSALDAFDGICPEKCGGSTTFTAGMRLPDAPEPDTVGFIKDVVMPGTSNHAKLVTVSLDKNNVATKMDNVVFKANVYGVATMTTRLEKKLAVLGGILKKDGNFNQKNAKVFVEMAYVVASDEVNTQTVTYHHEGRAIRMSLLCDSSFTSACATQEMVTAFAFATSNAGFDWVTLLDDGQTVYASVSEDGCSTPIDLVFLLDSSGSIEDAGLGGVPGQFAAKELEFVKAVIGAFDVGPAANQTRVGVASFSTENKVNFELNQHKTNSAVLSAVDDIEYMGFGTYTREGIDLVRTSMFTEDAGMRADDAAIPRVLIIVTDGQSNQGHSPIINARYDSWSTWSIDAETLFDGSAADKLHEADINVFSIGVGNGITNQAQDELDGMASDPDDDHSFVLKSFSRIFSIVDKISTSACNAAAALACGSQTVVELEEGVFNYFTVANSDEALRVSVQVETLQGEVHAFASKEVQTPGPFYGEVSETGSETVKTVEVSGEALYIGVKGAATGINSARVTMTCLEPTTSTTTTVTATTATATTTTTLIPIDACEQVILRGAGSLTIGGVYVTDTTKVINERSLYVNADSAYSMFYKWKGWNIGSSLSSRNTFLAEKVQAPQEHTEFWAPWDSDTSQFVENRDITVRCYSPATCDTVYVTGFLEYLGTFKVRTVNGAYKMLGERVNNRPAYKLENDEEEMYLYFNKLWRFHSSLGSNSYVVHLGWDATLHPVDVDYSASGGIVDSWASGQAAIADALVSCKKPDATTVITATTSTVTTSTATTTTLTTRTATTKTATTTTTTTTSKTTKTTTTVSSTTASTTTTKTGTTTTATTMTTTTTTSTTTTSTTTVTTRTTTSLTTATSTTVTDTTITGTTLATTTKTSTTTKTATSTTSTTTVTTRTTTSRTVTSKTTTSGTTTTATSATTTTVSSTTVTTSTTTTTTTTKTTVTTTTTTSKTTITSTVTSTTTTTVTSTTITTTTVGGGGDDDFGGSLCDGKPCSDAGGDVDDAAADDDGDGELCGGKPCVDSDGVQLSVAGGDGGGPGKPVPEDTPIGEVVIQLAAPTTPNGTRVATTFTVQALQKRRRATESLGAGLFATPDPDALAFKVNESTGTISVASALDYETVPWYSFAVIIRAGGDEGGKFLPYTAVVPLNISISPVACPRGTWSRTGTHPCVEHSPRCLVGFNESAAPSATNDRECSKLSQSIADDKDSNASVTAAIAALLVVAAVCLVVVALLYKRSADQAKDDVDSMESGAAGSGGLNPMLAGNPSDGVYLAPMLTGAPGVPRSRPELAYHRVVSYDGMYHGNTLLALPDASVARIYRHFQLTAPSNQELASFRTKTRQFLDLPVAQTGAINEGNLHDAVEFIARAMADVLVERAIDCLIEFEPDSDLTPASFAAACFDGPLVKDYKPIQNQFLEAVDGFTFEELRQLIGCDGDGGINEAVYAMAGNETNPSQHEYMAADGTQESAYEMAAASKMQATYEMAMGMQPGTATYEMAAAYSKQQGMADYEMANNVGAGMADYEMANAHRNTHASNAYDTGAARPESALYAMATHPGGQATYEVASSAGRRGGSGEATYEMATAVPAQTGSGSSRPPSNALYSLGAEASGGESNDYGTAKKLSLGGAEVEESSDSGGARRGLPQQTYDLGGPGGDQDGVEDSSTDISPQKRSNSYGDALDTVGRSDSYGDALDTVGRSDSYGDALGTAGLVSPASLRGVLSDRGSVASGLLEPTSPERTTFEFAQDAGNDEYIATAGALAMSSSGRAAAISLNLEVEADDVVVDAEDGYFELNSSNGLKGSFSKPVSIHRQDSGDYTVKSVRRANPMYRNSYLPKQTSEEA